MANGLWEKLRGARRIEFFAALVIAALLALILAGSRGGGETERTELEARLERILSGVDGAGGVRVMINQDGEGRAVGALIVADKLEGVGAYLSLQRGVSTLLGLEPSQIEIIDRDGSFGGMP